LELEAEAGGCLNRLADATDGEGSKKVLVVEVRLGLELLSVSIVVMGPDRGRVRRERRMKDEGTRS
jgi:hypothetical protein